MKTNFIVLPPLVPKTWVHINLLAGYRLNQLISGKRRTIIDAYVVTVLLDINKTQDVDDRAESRFYIVAD